MTRSKYDRAIAELRDTGLTKMTCHGNSMLPILENPSTCTYVRQEGYHIGDIVFCRVRGRYIDAHKIVGVSGERGYLIANNRGHENGWTHTVYGRVIHAEFNSGEVRVF